jgi:hypothetical protein
VSGSRDIRRTLGWLLVASLCVAALTAIVAILTDSFDDDDWRFIAMSLVLAVFGSTAAAGAALRFRAGAGLRTLGLVTIVLSAAAYALFVISLWNDDSDTAWRCFGVVGLTAFSASHASIVIGGRRERDSDAIRAIAVASIALSLVVSSIGILGIAEALDDVGEGFGRLVGVIGVLLLLTTALPPILRRLQRGGEACQHGARGAARREDEAAYHGEDHDQ